MVHSPMGLRECDSRRVDSCSPASHRGTGADVPQSADVPVLREAYGDLVAFLYAG